MRRNRKVVFKAVDYTSCDDFAHFLEEMAAKGWHFKEWSTGLVFEKGEPEQAVYAVEVFIDGSEYDVRPGPHTLNFADYCEAAGWKLIDGKRKFCIFKQLRPDAEPILTPQERVKNASKAFLRELLLQGALSLFLLIAIVLNFMMPSSFLTTVFSNTMLISMGIYGFYILFNVTRLTSFGFWKRRANQQAEAGEYRVLNGRMQSVAYWCSILIIILFLVSFALQEKYLQLAWFMGYILIFGGAAWIIAKRRPDPETNSLIQTGAVVAVFLLFAVGTAVLIATDNNETHLPEKEDAPLTYQDLGVDAGECTSQYSVEQGSILGTHLRYSMYYLEEYPERSLSYTVYKTEHQWILDRIWDQQLEAAYNTNRTDCTDAWTAVAAFNNDQDQYYVRYEDAILILSAKPVTLTDTQIDTVIDLLELR